MAPTEPGLAGLPFDATDLHTERAVLRPFAARDLADVVALLGREDVVRYLDWDLHSEQEAAQALKRWAEMTRLASDGDSLYLAVEVAGTAAVEATADGDRAAGRRRVVGEIVVQLESAGNGRLEIGWIFHPDVHGRGLAGEAAGAVLALLFGRLGAHRVVAKLDTRNTASARLAERLGMRPEGVLRADHVTKGEWVSVAIHGILAEEYVAAWPLPTTDPQSSA